MKSRMIIFCMMLFQIGFSQQYDAVICEKENIDSDNEIYKTGNVFIYDYEIIHKNQQYKLQSNKEKFGDVSFKLTPTNSDSIGVEKIHLIVQPVLESERTNENQTQISYLQEPFSASISSTGVIENKHNVWIHPIRSGFFNCLETAPFPFVKKPITINLEWSDQMKIGEGWGNEMWGKWKGSLLLTYHYKIVKKQTLKLKIGEVECYVIESTAKSDIGTTKLTSYFSEKYGFVRLEYELLNDLKVNMWLVDFKTNQKFNDTRTFFETKEYIRQ